jgi:hypothetical protein
VLHDYAARSLADLARVDVFLEDRLGGERELGIWGIGEAAFKLLALGSLSSRKLSALADANPARFGLRIGGVAVGAPETIAPAGLPIVVASFLRSASILESARHIGLPNPLVTLEGWRER